MIMGDTVLGERLLLGRTPDGLRAYVTVTIKRREGGATTVEHEPIGRYDELSIVGGLYEGRSGFRDSQNHSVGQCTEEVASVLASGGQLARGVQEADVRFIVETWRRWHLNGMQAGCAHVTAVGNDSRQMLDETPPCPTSGYRWGSAWLVESLPDGLVDKLREVCERLSQ